MVSASILIIEDDALEAEHLKLHLQQTGHHVVDAVATGEQAIIRAQQGDIDLMMVDIMLAGEIDGVDTVQQIRQQQDIPTIFLSAHVSDELLQRAEKVRPFGYLLKPYRQREMEFMVSMSLARAKFERDLMAQRQAAESKLNDAYAVIQHTHEGVVMVDMDNNITSVNPAVTRITGYEAAELVEQKISVLAGSDTARGFYASVAGVIQRSGHWQGEVENRRKSNVGYPAWLTIDPIYGPDGSTTQYVIILSDITQTKQAEDELERLAHHDPLTGLPNRLLLMTQLRHSLYSASRNQRISAVLYIDLDRFKLINDSLGHDMGDRVLKDIARRFESQLREIDMVARIGGDEFVVLLEDIDDPLDAFLVAEKMVRSLLMPVQINEHEFLLTCSIGIATYPKDGSSVEELLRDADSAMYRAKKAGPNTITFYTEEMTEEANHRLKLLNDLRLGLVNKEFELYYQPQINIQTGALCGAEALIRWHHPERGFTGPTDFILEAEESGLILPIGEWVLQEACSTMKTWLEQGIDFGKISVNVAGPQLQSGHLSVVVNQALQQSGLSPERLELELTETYAMELIQSHSDTMNSLHSLGVNIAIDDFGTGTSSLSRLKNLHIDKLKIDRSFVVDIPEDKEAVAIARAIIALAASLGLSAIAEGVETKEQQHFFLNEDCNLAQGYLFSKPLTKTDFETFFLSLS